MRDAPSFSVIHCFPECECCLLPPPLRSIFACNILSPCNSLTEFVLEFDLLFVAYEISVYNNRIDVSIRLMSGVCYGKTVTDTCLYYELCIR